MTKALTKVSATEVLNVAKSQIGYVEGRNNFSKYGKWYDQPGYANAAWCAMFVSWCFHEAGSPLPPIQHPKGFAYCPFGVNYFRKIGRFYQTPAVGDIVFFDWQRDGTSDHVGLVLEVKSSKNIITIEGNTSYRNQSHGGQVMKRSRLVSLCQGFARPDYGNTSRVPLWNGRYQRLTNPLLRGDDIRQLQQKLRERGYDIDVDGYFGDQTRQVVGDFQKANNLEADGIVGPDTWNEVFK